MLISYLTNTNKGLKMSDTNDIKNYYVKNTNHSYHHQLRLNPPHHHNTHSHIKTGKTENAKRLKLKQAPH